MKNILNGITINISNMENKLNLPPFYVGQKVVYIGWVKYLKGTTHTVLNCYTASCGCWNIETDNLPHEAYNHCSACNNWTTQQVGRIGAAKSFKPLEEMNAPLLTFQQIKEVEKEEVLILN